MNFISFDFLFFVALVTGLYYLLPLRMRAAWLLVASAVFYMLAQLRFLIFLGLSIVSCFFAAKAMARAGQKRKKLLMTLALLFNLGILVWLKYLPFAGRLVSGLLGLELNIPAFLVPLGISFYTLQAAGYLIDVYRGDVRPEEKLWRFALFMGFFPIIMQGPISRYGQLAPQLFEPRRLDYRKLKFGAQLMLWGFFKKMLIADRAAMLVNQVFNNHHEYAGLAVFVAMCLYTLQLYTDFSGCVDISRGCAGLLGIELAENFRRPLFSTSIQDFWRRWHISLSSWFRDYLYIPLGGSRRGELRKNINTLTVFAVSGLWHGAGLNYIFWGGLHGLYMVAGSLSRKLLRRGGSTVPAALRPALRAAQQAGCFLLVAFAFLFFRAAGLRTGMEMSLSMLSGPWAEQLRDGTLLSLGLDLPELILLGLGLLVLLLVSLLQERVSLRERIAGLSLPLRWAIYLGGILAVLVFGIYGPGYSSAQFIYMNF